MAKLKKPTWLQIYVKFWPIYQQHFINITYQNNYQVVYLSANKTIEIFICPQRKFNYLLWASMSLFQLKCLAEQLFQAQIW